METVLRRKRETKWVFQSKSVYPYDVNKKVDICENAKNMRFKSDEEIVEYLFSSLSRLFQRD